MSDQRDLYGDVNRVVRSWLREDRHEDANRVLGAVLDEVDTTPQRGTGRFARRTPTMNKFIALGLAAAAVVVAAFIGIQYFGGSNVGGPGPSETPVPSASPIALLNAPNPLDPDSRYQVNAGPGLDVTVAVPSGWSGSGDWVVIGPRGNDAPDGMAVRFYSGALNLYVNPLNPAISGARRSAGHSDPQYVTDRSIFLGVYPVESVYGDPCQWQGSLPDPQVGPTVDDFATALANQPTREGTMTDVTLDGYSGKKVTLSTPADINFADCDLGIFGTWTETGSIEPSRYSQGPGQVEDVYIIDVDGVRLVLDASWFPDQATPDELAELASVISSMDIQP